MNFTIRGKWNQKRVESNTVMFSVTYLAISLCSRLLRLKQFSPVNSHNSHQKVLLIGMPFQVICRVTLPNTELPSGLTVTHSPLYLWCLMQCLPWRRGHSTSSCVEWLPLGRERLAMYMFLYNFLMSLVTWH